jgi:serine/threonine protein phosphatase PrpC
MRRGQILGRTRDHSHIEHLIARGLADPSERATHPDRNKLYNCLGASSLPKIEVSRLVGLQAGDVIMLCSDGLWSMLSDEEIVHRLSTQTIVRAIPDLISMATTIAGDTSDNTTALAIMWQGTPDEEAPSAVTAGMGTVISTMMLPDNLVSTTIQSAPEPEAEVEIDAFNDDEIEKAIAEIRDAIDKSSKLLKQDNKP